jgi:hypothetical protein
MWDGDKMKPIEEGCRVLVIKGLVENIGKVCTVGKYIGEGPFILDTAGARHKLYSRNVWEVDQGMVVRKGILYVGIIFANSEDKLHRIDDVDMSVKSKEADLRETI